MDDGSTDDSVDFVRRNYPEVQVIALPDNRGFCQTVNVGIRWAKEDAIFLLNNDARLDPKCLQVLSGALGRFPEVDSFALSIVRQKGKILESSGAAIGPDGRFFQRGRNLDFSSLSLERLNPAPAFGNSGGGGLYRRRLFEDIGFFDEDFVMYHEDQDFNFRARLRDHMCLYLPEAIVYHLGSASLGSHSPHTIELLVRNQLLALAKSLPLALWLRYLPKILAAQIRSGAFYADQGHGTIFIRAAAKVLWRIPSILRKRGPIQARRSISNTDLRRLMES